MAFSYTAKDAGGNTLRGTIEAEDRENALLRLSREGLNVLEMDADTQESTLIPKRVRKSDIIYATSQLSVMIDTGISLAEALDGIAQQEANPTLRRVLTEVKERVGKGEDFSSALAQFPRYFDATYVALVTAAEQSGTLAEMLDRISHYMRGELEARGKVRAAMAYPAVMGLLAIGVTVFLLTVIMPKFTPLFSRRGVELPMVTRVMMDLSQNMTHYWYAWLAGAAAAAGFYAYARRTLWGRRCLDGAKLRLPLLGKIFRKTALSRSIRTLGTMIQSGVPMLEAIRLSSEVSANFHYQQVWEEVEEQVTQGNRISDVLAESPLFPSTLVQMIRAGEETGKLDVVLQKVSLFYDREVEMTLKATTSLIEPLLICVMGAVVGTIGLSILLPIFSLSRVPH